MTIEEDDNKGQRRTPTDLPLVGICLRAAATNTVTKRDETSGKQKTGKRSHGVDAGSGAKMGLWVKGGEPLLLVDTSWALAKPRISPS